MDNLSAHKGTDIRRWAKKHKVELCFGPLRQFTIANARQRDVLAAERRERARIRGEKGIRWGGRPLTTAA